MLMILLLFLFLFPFLLLFLPLLPFPFFLLFLFLFLPQVVGTETWQDLDLRTCADLTSLFDRHHLPHRWKSSLSHPVFQAPPLPFHLSSGMINLLKFPQYFQLKYTFLIMTSLRSKIYCTNNLENSSTGKHPKFLN